MQADRLCSASIYTVKMTSKKFKMAVAAILRSSSCNRMAAVADIFTTFGVSTYFGFPEEILLVSGISGNGHLQYLETAFCAISPEQIELFQPNFA